MKKLDFFSYQSLNKNFLDAQMKGLIEIDLLNSRVKSGNFRQRVNSDIHLQTVKIQMRPLLMSSLIRIFSVCLVNLFFTPIILK